MNRVIEVKLRSRDCLFQRFYAVALTFCPASKKDWRRERSPDDEIVVWEDKSKGLLPSGVIIHGEIGWYQDVVGRL